MKDFLTTIAVTFIIASVLIAMLFSPLMLLSVALVAKVVWGVLIVIAFVMINYLSYVMNLKENV